MSASAASHVLRSGGGAPRTQCFGVHSASDPTVRSSMVRRNDFFRENSRLIPRLRFVLYAYFRNYRNSGRRCILLLK
jgi:hypothetical protein